MAELYPFSTGSLEPDFGNNSTALLHGVRTTLKERLNVLPPPSEAGIILWQISKPYGLENERKGNYLRALRLDLTETTKVVKSVQKLYRHNDFIAVFQRHSLE